MTPRSFWLILIKLVGVWLLFSYLSAIPQSFSYIFSSLVDVDDPFNRPFEIVAPSLILLSIFATYIGISLLLIFKGSFIIDKLKLDQGFAEEKFEMNISQTAILRIAVIILGGLMFIRALPALFRHLHTFLTAVNQQGVNYEPDNKGWIIYTFIETVIAYLLMTNSRTIVNFINRKEKEEY